jgi:hypothetical protein
MSDHLAAGGVQLDPARFGTKGPLRRMAAARAFAITNAMAEQGAHPSEVRRFLDLHGFDHWPVFDVIEGGKGKSDG